ncbi:MAG: cysteine-rich CWC family protein [Chitinophagaceae bacterium]|nr:cysteine-rich CWC family protein [Chitinophagaceae bacterium]
MAKHETKKCSRCNQFFECKAGSITQCQCFAVSLSLEERNYLSQHFDDCLCADCLQVLKIKYRDSAGSNNQPDPLLSPAEMISLQKP